MILSFDIEQWSDSGFSYNDAFDHCCYRNFFENVLRPLCVENGLRPVLYCVARDSKLIDYWLREFDLINKVIIGSHSVTHRKLSQIGDDEFFEEIKLSKDILENELGVACLHFRAPRFEIPLSKDRFYETLFNAGLYFRFINFFRFSA